MKLREIQRLRGIAILFVVVDHSPFTRALLPPSLCESWSGVDLFFVISGFVVARTLLADLPETAGEPFAATLASRRAAIKAFYARRLYRLLPMVLFTIAATLALILGWRGQTTLGPARWLGRDAVLVLSGTYNYVRDTLGDDTTLGAMWSLCVEEHFYLVVPLLLILLRTRSRRLVGSLAGIALVAGVVRPLTPHLDSRIIFDSHLRFDELLAGVALALAATAQTRQPTLLPPRFLRLVVVPAALLLVVLIPGVTPQPLLNEVGLVPIWLFSALLVSLAARDEGLVLAVPVAGDALEWLGERSYSAYLLHPPLIQLWLELDRRRLVPSASSSKLTALGLELLLVGAVALVAAVTYRLIEAPFLAAGRARIAAWRAATTGEADTRAHVPATAERPRPLWRPLAAAAALVLVAATGARLLALAPRGAAVWHGEYFAGTRLSGAAQLRDDAALEFYWGDTPPLAGLPRQFSARWRSCLQLPRAQTVRFIVASDDGLRLRVDGVTAWDQWRSQPMAFHDVDVTLAAGAHLVEVEYFNQDGDASLVVRAALEGAPPRPLGPDHLAPATLRAGQPVCAPPAGVTATL